jgi:hypothetical protein
MTVVMLGSKVAGRMGEVVGVFFQEEYIARELGSVVIDIQVVKQES